LPLAISSGGIKSRRIIRFSLVLNVTVRGYFRSLLHRHKDFPLAVLFYPNKGALENEKE